MTIFFLNKYLFFLGLDQLKLARKLPCLLFPVKPILKVIFLESFIIATVEIRE